MASWDETADEELYPRSATDASSVSSSGLTLSDLETALQRDIDTTPGGLVVHGKQGQEGTRLALRSLKGFVLLAELFTSAPWRALIQEHELGGRKQPTAIFTDIPPGPYKLYRVSLAPHRRKQITVNIHPGQVTECSWE